MLRAEADVGQVDVRGQETLSVREGTEEKRREKKREEKEHTKKMDQYRQ